MKHTKKNAHNKELLKDRTTQLDLSHFEMFKETEYRDNLKIKRPTGVLDFAEPKLSPTKNHLQVTGFYDNGF